MRSHPRTAQERTLNAGLPESTEPFRQASARPERNPARMNGSRLLNTIFSITRSDDGRTESSGRHPAALKPPASPEAPERKTPSADPAAAVRQSRPIPPSAETPRTGTPSGSANPKAPAAMPIPSGTAHARAQQGSHRRRKRESVYIHHFPADAAPLRRTVPEARHPE